MEGLQEMGHEMEGDMEALIEPSMDQQVDMVGESQEPAEEAPWYGSTKYDIVDHVDAMMREKELRENISPVQLAALRAQLPYKTLSMKDLGDNYDGPPKYLNQRDAPLEIPYEVIKKLFVAMDEDLDDMITLEEFMRYIKKHELAIPKEVAVDMYHEATSKRSVIHKEQLDEPLKIEEIQMAVRGRFC